MSDGHGLGLASVFDESEIRELGALYLDEHPAESDIDLLKRMLLKGADDRELDDDARRDFDNGDTVNLDGWVLSRTEARRYALYALSVD